MYNIVYVVDTSLSMRRSYNDLMPNKIEAVKESLIRVSSRVIDKIKDSRIGLVVFYGYAFPLLRLTRNKRSIITTISRLRILGEGSAPGNGLIEAVKIMRGSNGVKKAIIITDGGFNEGIPLDIASIYASNSGVRVDMIVIGDRLKDSDIYYIEKTTTLCSGAKFFVNNRGELLKALYNSSYIA